MLLMKNAITADGGHGSVTLHLSPDGPSSHAPRADALEGHDPARPAVR